MKADESGINFFYMIKFLAVGKPGVKVIIYRRYTLTSCQS